MGKNEVNLGTVTIKKYANRRLYNTATSSYVTLGDLCQMVKSGRNFTVHDAKTNEDITRTVLTQIIVEEESKGHNLLPISFLRQLISFYGDSLSRLIPRYLEYSMQAFSQHEEQIRSLMQNALDGLFPFSQLEEMGKKNISFLESTMKMFTPFYSNKRDTSTSDKISTSIHMLSHITAYEVGLEELRTRLDVMQKQLDQLLSGTNEVKKKYRGKW